MPEKRPLGWRPYSDEYRQELRDKGLAEETIAALENENVYSPVQSAVWSTELAFAILEAMAKRLGAEFVEDVRSALIDRATKLQESDIEDENIEAPMVAALIEYADWNSIIARAAGGVDVSGG
jgi:hypothetical protein